MAKIVPRDNCRRLARPIERALSRFIIVADVPNKASVATDAISSWEGPPDRAARTRDGTACVC
jgi:hypothetical protein